MSSCPTGAVDFGIIVRWQLDPDRATDWSLVLFKFCVIVRIHVNASGVIRYGVMAVKQLQRVGTFVVECLQQLVLGVG